MFYKYENENLTYGPYVLFADGVFITVETKDMFTFPMDGWHYFETEQEAKDFFGITE